MSWNLATNDSIFFIDVKIYEGSKEFQAVKGMYKNGKFWTYKDSLGLPTIGYGHLIRPGEDFSSGLTDAEADALLLKDARNAYNDAKSIYIQYKMSGPIELQRVLWQMVFQMGKSSVLNFRKALTAMGECDYKTASKEMRNSKWYRQTTSRAEKLARIVESLQ